MRDRLKRLVAVIYSCSFRGRQMIRYFGRPATWRRFHRAAAVHQSNVWMVAWRALRLYLKERFSPADVLERGLADPAWSLDRYREHLCDARLHGLQGRINPPHAAVCRDKLMFHSHCRAHGLPVPTLHAVLSAYGSRTDGDEPMSIPSVNALESWAHQADLDSVVVKPRMGNKGRDVRLLRLDEEMASHGTDPDLRLADLFNELRRDGDDWLVEEVLTAHPDIANLTGRNRVSSVRVFTVVEDGVSAVMDGYFRIVVGDAFADNINSSDDSGRTGNVLGSVDVSTGRIVDAFRPRMDGIGLEDTTRHPDSGLAIVGFELPCWAAIRELVCRAAVAFMPIVTIGWDVAITGNGPVLIEANEKYQHAGVGEGPRRVRERLERLAEGSVNRERSTGWRRS